jgi:PAS domain S-box-containing protein
LYGWNEAEALSMNSLGMIAENARAEAITLYQRIAKGENIRSFETQRITRDGKTLDIWMTLTALVNDANQRVGVATTERDITDRKQDSQRCSFEIRALKALNHWYQTLLDNTGATSQSLAEAACQILVKESGYRQAWIGKVQQGNATMITPVAWVRVENGEAERLAEVGREVLERALRSGQPAAGRDRSANQPVEVMEQPDWIFLALPLLFEKTALGILVIYADETESFVEPEVTCLEEYSRRVAQVIGPNLQTLERQANEHRTGRTGSHDCTAPASGRSFARETSGGD